MRYPNHNLLFIHVPKTGGTSISTKLTDTLKNEERLTPHATLQDWAQQLGKNVLKEQFSFAVVRNPWDRMVSWYGYRFSKRTPLDEQPEKFRAWLKSFDHNHWEYRPQLDWLLLDNKLAIKWLLRFENLDAAWRELTKSLPGLESVAPLDTLNASRRRKRYQQYYDDETRDLVAQLYRQDIEAFDYLF